MWGSVETTLKLGLTGLAGFTLAPPVIETAGTVIGTAVAGSSNGQNYVGTRTVVKIITAPRAEFRLVLQRSGRGLDFHDVAMPASPLSRRPGGRRTGLCARSRGPSSTADDGSPTPARDGPFTATSWISV